jgi:hypothetical protein
MTPYDLLMDLFFGTTGYGYFTIGPVTEQGPKTTTSATTSGLPSFVGIGNGASQLTITGVDIQINTLTGSFVNGSDQDRAITVLHELGHAFAMIWGAGGSQIQPDGPAIPNNVNVSEDNTALIKNCFP